MNVRTTTRTLVRSTAAIAALLALAAPAAAAAKMILANHGTRVAAATAAQVNLFSTSTKFTRAGKPPLWISLSAVGESVISKTPELLIGVTDNATAAGDVATRPGVIRPATTAAGYEYHLWEFKLTKDSFTHTEKTGAASINTSTQMNPFGKVSLTFTKSSKKSATCKTSGSEKVYSGSLSGTLFFNTNSEWGSAGSKSKKLVLATPTILTFDHQCTNPITPTAAAECSTSVSWSASTSGTGIFMDGGTGTGSGSSGFILMERNVKLSTPSGATRGDIVNETSPAPTLKNKVLTIKTASNEVLFSGKATIAQGHPYASNSACKVGKKTKTQTDTTYLESKYIKGSPALTGKPAIGGPVVPVNGKTSSITVSTYA